MSTNTKLDLNQAVRTWIIIRLNKGELLKNAYLVEIENWDIVKQITIDKFMSLSEDREFWKKLLYDDVVFTTIRNIERNVKREFENLTRGKIKSYLEGVSDELLEHILNGKIMCQYAVEEPEDFGEEYIVVLCTYKLSDEDAELVREIVDKTVKDYLDK